MGCIHTDCCLPCKLRFVEEEVLWCGRYEDNPGAKMTNLDALRTMAALAEEEEVVELFFKLYSASLDGSASDLSALWCDGEAGCINSVGEIECGEEEIKGCIRRWLRAPAPEREEAEEHVAD